MTLSYRDPQQWESEQSYSQAKISIRLKSDERFGGERSGSHAVLQSNQIKSKSFLLNHQIKKQNTNYKKKIHVSRKSSKDNHVENS